MKRILWLAVIFFLLTPQLGVLGAHSFQSVDAIVLNGGFESDPTAPDNGWDWPESNWQWDASVFHEGSHSARVSRYNGEETPSLWSDPIDIQTSNIYTFSYWLRTENVNKNPSVVIYQYNTTGIQTGLRAIAYANVGGGTNNWSRVTYRFQTMPDAAYISIRIYLYTDTSGTFWLDDFSLDQGFPAIYPYSSGFPVEAMGWIYLSSPSVVDINHDLKNELLVGAGNSVYGWDNSGGLLPAFPLTTDDRYIYNQLAIADLDADEKMEILAGTRTANPPEGICHVYAWQDDGSPINGWPISVDWNPVNSNNDCKVTSVALADIDGNQKLEVLASTTNNASGNPNSGITPYNLYAWRADGTMASGNWPSKFTAAGFYGAIAAGDLNDDGIADILTARDHQRLNSYSGNGSSLSGWPVETYLDGNQGDYETDYRVVYGRSAPVLADLDNDGSSEFIVVGNVTGPGNSTAVINTALLVLNKDGTRFTGWERPALGNGVLTQEDMPQKSPAIGDINADGLPEIIVTTLDGWIRAYDLQKNLLWAFNYSQDTILFASEPVIGDIDGDNSLEIVFATHVPIIGNDYDGPVGLWSLEKNGTVTPGFPLPIPTPGVEAAPTLADLDNDGNLDILAATITGEIFVWNTPNPYYPARSPWPMARHDLQRTGTYVDPSSFGDSQVIGSLFSAEHGDIATFSIHVSSMTPIDEMVTLTNTLPAGITYLPGSLISTSGTAIEHHGVIQWSGVLPENLMVDISYQVTVDTNQPQFIINSVMIDTTIEGILVREAYLFANTNPVFLPTIHR